MQNFRFTIITPTWNMGSVLKDCIESVHSQSYKNIEHIIIDNKSTDNTKAIVNKYSSIFPIKFFSELDTGQANAINKGFKMASGDIVCWLNADDYFAHAEVFETVAQYFRLNPDVDIVTGSGYFVNEDNKRYKTIKLPQIVKLEFYDSILQPATFWKRNKILLNEQFHYTFDWIFFLDVKKAGMRFKVVPEEFAVYRMGKTNKTALDNAKRKHEILLVQMKYNSSAKLNILWCQVIFNLYKFSEKYKLSYIKKIALLINIMVSKLSMKRIYSC